jgi:hypothetical protein
VEIICNWQYQKQNRTRILLDKQIYDIENNEVKMYNLNATDIPTVTRLVPARPNGGKDETKIQE